MADISAIKDQIETELQELENDGDIGGYERLQFKKAAMDLTVGNYPHVILTPPSIESETLDNRHVIRTYTFDLEIIFSMEDLQTNDMENTTEKVMNHFDNLTDDLAGQADGGIRPSATAPQIVTDRTNENYANVTLELKVRATQTLTF